MDAVGERKRPDVERAVLVPLFLLMLLVNVSMGDWSVVSASSASQVVTALLLGYRALMVVFFVTLIVLLVARGPSSVGETRLAPRVAAYVGTFLPVLMPSAPGMLVAPELASFAVGLMALGLAFTLYSLAVLGRSFGVAPQVRELVRKGPYRYIRHPMYVGQFVVLVGAVAFDPTLWDAAVFAAWIAIQGYRAIQEERLLEANVPEYAAYKRLTKRFVPGVF